MGRQGNEHHAEAVLSTATVLAPCSRKDGSTRELVCRKANLLGNKRWFLPEELALGPGGPASALELGLL
eukprot:3853630-Amphidinium_carterae.2